MAEHDEVYGDERAQRLKDLLRGLAARLSALDAEGRLLEGGTEILGMLGDVRSELFHYEVRSTYETPEVADNRRIVEEAGAGWDFSTDQPEDDEPWRPPRPN